MIIESILYEKSNDSIENNKVQCNICAHHCIIKENSYGFCNTRKNVKTKVNKENKRNQIYKEKYENKLYSYNYARVSSYNIDPIEKKPLYHFLPGSNVYSIGGFGCNMRCLNCQNHEISQHFPEIREKNEIVPKMRNSIEILPEEVVENAINSNCQGIAWTYNEPTMYLEYVLETAKISKKSGLKNLFISNGYMSEESLDLLLPVIDGFNIDIKSMDDNFYQKVCQARLNPVLNNVKKIYDNGNHIEITNLLINNLNDSDKLIKSLSDFIAINLGKKVPLHFSRAFPLYKMNDISPTNSDTLNNAKEIAIGSGLENVYLGNIPSDQNSYCPNCGELLIERNGYYTEDNGKIKNNKCISCNKDLNFIK